MNFSAQGIRLMRKGLGALCVLDAALRLSQVSFMYSDLGALPRDVVYRYFDQPYALSLGMLSGQPIFGALLLAAIMVLGGLNFLGRDQRRGRILLWLLVLSIQMRNPAVLDAFDELIRLLLFWDIFLPQDPEPETTCTTWPALGLQCQLTFTLLFLALAQGTGETWSLAASWGQQPLAMKLPWLGLVVAALLGSGVLALWIPRARAVLIWPALLGAAVWTVALDPLMGLALLVGLLVALKPPASHQRLPREQRKQAVAVAVLVLLSLSWNLLPRPQAVWPLRVMGEALGLAQNWERTYPLASNERHSITLKSGVTDWPLPQDRRSQLLVQTVSEQRELADPLARAFMRARGLEGTVEVWQQTNGGEPILIHSIHYQAWRRP